MPGHLLRTGTSLQIRKTVVVVDVTRGGRQLQAARATDAVEADVRGGKGPRPRRRKRQGSEVRGNHSCCHRRKILGRTGGSGHAPTEIWQ